MSNFDLERFVKAQSLMYPVALSEMKNGCKTSHWIWYVFPQLKGLGMSYNSQYYGLDGAAEAKAYLEHPVLGPRLIEITEAVLTHSDKRAKEIFGSSIDAKKFCSSMTLFREIAPEEKVFDEALQVFYNGKPDGYTLSLLKGTPEGDG